MNHSKTTGNPGPAITGERLCGKNYPAEYISKGSKLLLHLKSDSYPYDPSKKKNFWLTVEKTKEKPGARKRPSFSLFPAQSKSSPGRKPPTQFNSNQPTQFRPKVLPDEAEADSMNIKLIISISVAVFFFILLFFCLSRVKKIKDKEKTESPQPQTS